MKVKVEQCFNGHNLYYRLTLPDGSREFITSDTWKREQSIAAKNLIETLYKIPRNKIRFI